MPRNYSNVSKTMTLTAPMGIPDVTCNVNDASGLPAGFPYNIAVDYGGASVEIMSVTSAAGNILTVVRGQEDTAAATHAVGATVVHAATALDFQDAQAHYSASSNVHGTGAGSVVGTSTTQTLTNKTISGASNSITNVAAANVVGTFSNIVTNQTNPAAPSLKANAAVTPTANIVELGANLVINTTGQLQTMAGAGTYSQRWYGANFSTQVAEMSSAGLLTCVGVTSTGLINANAGITVPSGQTLTTASGSTVTNAATGTYSGTNTFSGTVNLNGTVSFGAASTVTLGNGFTVPSGKVGTFTGDIALNGALNRDSSAAKPLMYSNTVIVPNVFGTSSGSFADISTVTDTFTVPAGRTATVEVTWNVNGLCSTAGVTYEWVPMIDGTNYQSASNGTAATFFSSGDIMVSFSFTTTLAAGAHTIKMRERRVGGTDVIAYRNPWSNMTLKVFW